MHVYWSSHIDHQLWRSGESGRRLTEVGNSTGEVRYPRKGVMEELAEGGNWSAV